jgi:aryl-alcohol dehydrogenase-like predicted oxidoreductase
MHTEKDIRYWNALRKFRDKGLAARLGISIDTAAAADSALNLDGVEAIQVPMNILDRRFRDDFLKKAKERGISVFTRSAFLQGLLLMPIEEITKEHFLSVVPVRRRLFQFLFNNGLLS